MKRKVYKKACDGSRLVDKTRKRAVVVLVVLFTVFVLCMLGVVVYYELKFRSLLGIVYANDQSMGITLTHRMFQTKINGKNLSNALLAVQKSGYTEHGLFYLFWNTGGAVLLFTGAVILSGMAAMAVLFAKGIGNHDVYEKLKTAEQETEKMKKELEMSVEYAGKRNKQLQEFTENIAHQIKTPLAGLSLSLEVLREELKTGEFAENIENDMNQCFLHVSRIKEFIQRLLKISRMESGKVIFVHEDINIYDMLMCAKEAVQNTCPVHICCTNQEYIVNGDSQWLMEAFINVIENACWYAKQGEAPFVNIVVQCFENKCVVTVEDNGPGFQEQQADRIFNRFETNGDYQSFHVGIGLNLSKLIIKAHHGTIQAYNREGNKGAVFRIVIPRFLLKRGKQI